MESKKESKPIELEKTTAKRDASEDISLKLEDLALVTPIKSKEDPSKEEETKSQSISQSIQLRYYILFKPAWTDFTETYHPF